MKSSPSASSKKSALVLCDCKCGHSAIRNRLVEVSVNYIEEMADGTKRIRTGRRFWVRPECENPFKLELNLMAQIHGMAGALDAMPWWRRIPKAPALFKAKYRHDLRLKGRALALRAAFRSVAVMATPEWLSMRLVDRWKPAKSIAPATPAPALPSGPR